MKSINTYLNEALINKNTKLKSTRLPEHIINSFFIQKLCPQYYDIIINNLSKFIDNSHISKVDGPYYDASEMLHIEKILPELNNYYKISGNSKLLNKFFDFTTEREINLFKEYPIRVDLFNSNKSEIGVYGFPDVILFELIMNVPNIGYCSLSIMYEIIR